MFECILKEPEEVKKPAPAPSPPAEKPEVPKKGTLFSLLFDSFLVLTTSSSDLLLSVLT